MKGWIQIFKTGNHISSNGKGKTWTRADLDKMVDRYHPADHEAPAVIGHPKNNAPAFGWLEKVKRSGDILLGKFKQVAPEFSEMLKAGRFKKRSISVYPDGTIRHVGFLGAQPPAVKGLRDFQSINDDAIIYEFKEQEAVMPKTVEELQKQIEEEKKKRLAAEKKAKEEKKRADDAAANFEEASAASRKKEIADFVEQGIQDGKILPAWKDKGISNFMGQLDAQEETFEFAEGKKETGLDWFKGFIDSFSAHPLFKEMAIKDDETSQAASEFAEDEKEAEEMAAEFTGE